MAQTFIQVQPSKLSGSGITATATTIILQSFKFPGTEDTVLTADIGDICYATLEPNTAREEIISFTTITQNADGTATLTGVTRNLDTASPYTQISATGYAHAGGTLLVVSNNPQLYNDLASNANDETITGTWTFDGDAFPRVDNSAQSPVTDAEFVTKKYADDLAIAGAPDSTTGVKGIVEKATSAETIAGTDTGGTTAPLFPAPSDVAKNIQSGTFVYAADAGSNDTYVITLIPALTAYAAGQSIYFKANTVNTGACTLNINSLGAKSIKKNHDQDPEDGDIEANSIVHVIYDGTNFQLQTQQATMPTTAILSEMSTFFGATNITGAEAEILTDGSTTALHKHGIAIGTASRTGADGSGTQQITCGFAPRLIKIKAVTTVTINSNAGLAFFADGVSDGTNHYNMNVYEEFGADNSAKFVSRISTSTLIDFLVETGTHTGWQATITATDATTFTITWTETNAANDVTFYWEAYG